MQELELPRSELLALLRGHAQVSRLPDAELDWLLAHGRYVRIPAGEALSYRHAQLPGMYIMTKGQVAILVERGGVKRRVMEWNAGDVTGHLPFSRMVSPPGDTITIVETDALFVSREEFPALIRECPELTSVVVHVLDPDLLRVKESSRAVFDWAAFHFGGWE